jgi:hypothetical protein
MKIRVLKNILLPVNSVIGNRRRVIGDVIEVKDKLERYSGWIEQKITEGVFEKVKETKKKVNTVAESIKEETQKPKRKYTKKAK